jgi:hypothetical protein
LLVAVLACGGKGGSSSDSATYKVAMPESVDQVATKAAPDTLFNANGEHCIVRPAPKFDGVSVGDTYSCNWER